MVRESRIKEHIFPTWTVEADNTGSTFYSQEVLNGELLEVIGRFDRAGSISIGISGTNEEVWRRNTLSGTNAVVCVPRKFSESTTGSIGAASHIPFTLNDKLILSTGSMTSGTVPFNVTVKYR